MLNFSHTCLYFKNLIRTYFCEIYVILWDLIEVKKTKFLIPKICDLALCRSTGRSIETEDGRLMCTNVHSHLAGGPVDRPVRPSREFCYLDLAPVDRPESSALWIQPRSIGRSTDGTTVKNSTVGRSTGQSTDSCISC